MTTVNTVNERTSYVEVARGMGAGAIVAISFLFYLLLWFVEIQFLADSSWGYRIEPWYWLAGHVLLWLMWIVAVVMAGKSPGNTLDTPRSRSLARWSVLWLIALFVLPAIANRALGLDETPDNVPVPVVFDEVFLADRPVCEELGNPSVYFARDPNNVFEFAATPPLSDDPETMLNMLFNDILCEDEVNTAGHMTGMKEAVQLEGQSTDTQGNALAPLLANNEQEWHRSLDILWERWTTSEIESVDNFAGMIEDGDANLLCQNPDSEGRPRLVQLRDVVLADLQAQVGNNLHAFLINRGDAPGFEDGRVAFLTDIGCFAFDEETFGESVDNVEQAEHGLTDEQAGAEAEANQRGEEDQRPEEVTEVAAEEQITEDEQAVGAPEDETETPEEETETPEEQPGPGGGGTTPTTEGPGEGPGTTEGPGGGGTTPTTEGPGTTQPGPGPVNVGVGAECDLGVWLSPDGRTTLVVEVTYDSGGGFVRTEVFDDNDGPRWVDVRDDVSFSYVVRQNGNVLESGHLSCEPGPGPGPTTTLPGPTTKPTVPTTPPTTVPKTTTTTEKVTTTTVPKTTTTTVPKTTTTTKPTTTTSTTQPTTTTSTAPTTTTTENKGTAPCSPFDPDC